MTKVQERYEVGTAREVLSSFRTIEEARTYVTTVRRAGFLPTIDADTLAIVRKVAR